jgi:8-oxo-dGTP diphosphatase
MKPVFTVRIYGILIENEQLLVSDEIHHGRLITKFPGGGLQFGEGTIECLTREFKEELDIPVEITNHYYTVDFFQTSAFDPSVQVVSIYYNVESKESSQINISSTKLSLENQDSVQQQFRWIKLSELTESDFTFPIDKRRIQFLKKETLINPFCS